MAKDPSNQALVEAADKLADQASKDGVAAEKAKDERAAAERKVTGGDSPRKKQD